MIDIVVTHRDLSKYYRNMGFMDLSSPADMLRKVIMPSMKTQQPSHSNYYHANQAATPQTTQPTPTQPTPPTPTQPTQPSN